MGDSNSYFFSLFSLLFTTFILLLNHSTASLAQTLFVFGDGVYDAGNKQFLSGNRVDANAPPYGITVGEATGRWSDGLIVPDYLAEFMRIPTIPPILRNSADFSHGANFAIAGATVLGFPLETMTLSQQVMKFTENKNRWSDKALSEAIYLLYIGTDDYLNYAKNNPNPSDEQKQAYVDQVILSIEAAIQVIYDTGGRKFAFQNLAPLGCLPVVKQEKGNGVECVELPSEMAALHNKNLLNLLKRLARTVISFQYSFYDFFSSVHSRVHDPDTYTFGIGTAACCGTGLVNGTGCAVSNVCGNPEEYVFFDGKHLTQEANLQVGHLIWGADPEVIEPINLRELLVLPLNIPAILGDTSDPVAAIKSNQKKIAKATSFMI